jgi:DNA-binding response OmpR family regulator
MPEGERTARTARSRWDRPSGCPTVGFVPGERILIVEDDERIGATLLRALEGSGYDARWEQSGRGALSAAAEQRPDLVLLDLGLPDMDGLDVCREIHRCDATIDVVMLTARDEELDVVVGLDAGAIDYVTKPFKLAELLARLRAQFRRAEPRWQSRTTAGDLVIDGNARRAWLGDDELGLRAKEFDLLARLVADAGNAVSRESLMADVWDEHWFGSTKTLDFHIAALRRKIDPADGVSRITTLRGVGYRFELP